MSSVGRYLDILESYRNVFKKSSNHSCFFITVIFFFSLSSYSQVPVLTIVILSIISFEFLGIEPPLLEGRGHDSLIILSPVI